jgi:hypothetical protein
MKFDRTHATPETPVEGEIRQMPRWGGVLFVLVSVWLTTVSAFAQLQAPKAAATVAAVIAAHPEINSCDEVARAILVDWAARRLNSHLPAPVWGRKSRGKPTATGVAVNPNTDGLTFLRPDGQFEIYDVISGSPPCGATWDGFGPFEQGANGWWAPPQLEAEFLGPIEKPPGVDSAELLKKIAALEAQIRQLHAEALATAGHVQALTEERDLLVQALAQTVRERDEARRERDALLAAPPPRCEAKIFGIKIGCRIVR